MKISTWSNCFRMPSTARNPVKATMKTAKIIETTAPPSSVNPTMNISLRGHVNPPKPLSSTRDQRRAQFKAQGHTHCHKKCQELRDKSFSHHTPKTAPAYKRRTNWRSWWVRGLLTNFGFKCGMEGTPAPPFEIEMLN